MGKDFKKIGIGIAISMLLVSNVAIAGQEIMKEVKFKIGDTQYTVGEQIKELDAAPYIKDGRTMLPVRYIAEAMGIDEKSIQWNPEIKTVTILANNQRIQLTVDTNELIIGENKIQMDTTPEIKNGRTMLPISYIAKALDVDPVWNSLTQTVTVNVGTSGEEDAQEASYDYTYEQLLEKVYQYDKSLKKAEILIERADVMKDQADDSRVYTPTGGGNGADDAAAVNTLKSFVSSDIQLKMAKKELDMEKDKLAYSVKTAYYAVLQSEEDAKLAKSGLEIARKEMERSSLMYEQGLMSKLDYQQAKRSAEEAENYEALAQKALKNNYEKLNSLVGFTSEERYTLNRSVEKMKNPKENLESHIRYMTTESPSIWLLEQQLELAKLGLKLYVYNAGQAPYDAVEIDVKTAELDLSSAKDNYEQALRNLDNTMKQLIDQYENLTIQFENAKDTLETVKLNYEIGLATSLDMKKASYQLEKITTDMEKNIMDYNKILEVYLKPWAGSGGNA